MMLLALAFVASQALAAREHCIVMDGVGVIPTVMVAGSTFPSTYGPVTKCSEGHLRITFADTFLDACGIPFSEVWGSYSYERRFDTSETVWIATGGGFHFVPAWACQGEGTLVRSVYGPGHDFLAAARAVFQIVEHR